MVVEAQQVAGTAGTNAGTEHVLLAIVGRHDSTAVEALSAELSVRPEVVVATLDARMEPVWRR